MSQGQTFRLDNSEMVISAKFRSAATNSAHVFDSKDFRHQQHETNTQSTDVRLMTNRLRIILFSSSTKIHYGNVKRIRRRLFLKRKQWITPQIDLPHRSTNEISHRSTLENRDFLPISKTPAGKEQAASFLL